MQNDDEIVGWENLTKRINSSQMTIKRLMIFYDFPLPRKVRMGPNMKVIWSRKAINEWIDNNTTGKQINLKHV